MAGQILVDFAHDARTHAAMIMFAQLAQRPRRSDDDQRFEIIRERMPLEHIRGIDCEAIFLLLMEIDLVHGAPAAAHA